MTIVSQKTQSATCFNGSHWQDLMDTALVLLSVTLTRQGRCPGLFVVLTLELTWALGDLKYS